MWVLTGLLIGFPAGIRPSAQRLLHAFGLPLRQE